MRVACRWAAGSAAVGTAAAVAGWSAAAAAGRVAGGRETAGSAAAASYQTVAGAPASPRAPGCAPCWGRRSREHSPT